MEDLPPELIYRISEESSYKSGKSLRYLNRHYYHHTHTDAYDKIMQEKYEGVRKKLSSKLSQIIDCKYTNFIYIDLNHYYFCRHGYAYVNVNTIINISPDELMDHMDKLLDRDSIYVDFYEYEYADKSESYKFWSQLGSVDYHSYNKVRVTIPIKEILNRYLDESN